VSAEHTPQRSPRRVRLRDGWPQIRRHHETSDEMWLRFARDVRDQAHQMQLDPDRPAGERTIAALFLEALGARERKAR
jgi:hypothetical protein